MGKRHKWADVIVAWSEGAEIECRNNNRKLCWTAIKTYPLFDDHEYEFRIKPQPKEPQYLYVFDNGYEKHFSNSRYGCIIKTDRPNELPKYIGKIKLEQDDEIN